MQIQGKTESNTESFYNTEFSSVSFRDLVLCIVATVESHHKKQWCNELSFITKQTWNLVPCALFQWDLHFYNKHNKAWFHASLVITQYILPQLYPWTQKRKNSQHKFPTIQIMLQQMWNRSACSCATTNMQLWSANMTNHAKGFWRLPRVLTVKCKTISFERTVKIWKIGAPSSHDGFIACSQ